MKKMKEVLYRYGGGAIILIIIFLFCFLIYKGIIIKQNLIIFFYMNCFIFIYKLFWYYYGKLFYYITGSAQYGGLSTNFEKYNKFKEKRERRLRNLKYRKFLIILQKISTISNPYLFFRIKYAINYLIFIRWLNWKLYGKENLRRWVICFFLRVDKLILRLNFFFYNMLEKWKNNPISIILLMRMQGLIIAVLIIWNIFSQIKGGMIIYFLILLILLFFFDKFPINEDRLKRDPVKKMFLVDICPYSLYYFRHTNNFIERLISDFFGYGTAEDMDRFFKIITKKNYDFVIRVLVNMRDEEILMKEIKNKPSFIIYESLIFWLKMHNWIEMICFAGIGEKYFKKEEDRKRAKVIKERILKRLKKVLNEIRFYDKYFNQPITYFHPFDMEYKGKIYKDGFFLYCWLYNEVKSINELEWNLRSLEKKKWEIREENFRDFKDIYKELRGKILGYGNRCYFGECLNFMDKKIEEDFELEIRSFISGELNKKEETKIRAREVYSILDSEYKWLINEFVKDFDEWLERNWTLDKIKEWNGKRKE